MGHGVAFVDHECYVPVDILKRIELGVRIPRHESAYGAVGTGAVCSHVELTVPVARILRIKDRHTMARRTLVSRDATRTRAHKSRLCENEIGAIGKINSSRSFFCRSPAVHRAGDPHLNPAKLVS